MKKVIDAVNEFKGEADGNYIYVGASSNHINNGNLQETYATIHNEKWWLLCTRDQFNDLVSQMETNFGKCDQSYADYNIAWTHAPISQSTKELEVMDIEWSKAPEGATHYVALGGDVVYYKIKDDDSKAYHNTWVSDFSEKEWLVDNAFRISNETQPTLTYTQAMADNGELPSVGMECLLSISDFAVIHPQDRGYNGSHCEIVAHVDTLAVAVVRDENSDVCFTITANYGWFNPLTLPITLIDGKAYQFDYSNKEYTGIYSDIESNKKADRFFFVDGHVMASHCTNIQPLTVEVK